MDNMFENDILQAIHSKIVKEISNVNLIDNYKTAKFKIPDEILYKIWDNLDWNNIINIVKNDIENTIAKTIVGNITTETKTDIKKVLSIDGVRKRLIAEVYPKVMNVLNNIDNDELKRILML